MWCHTSKKFGIKKYQHFLCPLHKTSRTSHFCWLNFGQFFPTKLVVIFKIHILDWDYFWSFWAHFRMQWYIHTDLKKPDFFEICGITADGQAISMSRHFRKKRSIFLSNQYNSQTEYSCMGTVFLNLKISYSSFISVLHEMTYLTILCYWNLNSLPH